MAANYEQQLANMRQAFFDQQLLNEQFLQREAVENDLPGFLEDYYITYFREAERFLGILNREIQAIPTDFDEMELYLNEFKTNTANAGAVKVLVEINRCLAQRAAMNLFGVFTHLADLEREVKHLKRQLKNYFKLRNQGPPTVIDDNPDFGDEDSDE